MPMRVARSYTIASPSSLVSSSVAPSLNCLLSIDNLLRDSARSVRDMGKIVIAFFMFSILSFIPILASSVNVPPTVGFSSLFMSAVVAGPWGSGVTVTGVGSSTTSVVSTTSTGGACATLILS